MVSPKNSLLRQLSALGSFVAVFLSAELALAKSLGTADLKAIQTKLKATQYLTVDFTQDVYGSLRNRHRLSSGVAYFKKPSSFRWNLVKQKRLEWIFNGKDLLSLEGDAGIVKKYGIGDAQGQELRRIVDMVMNLDTLLSSYDVKKAEDMGDTIYIEMTPKTETDIKQANLAIDKTKNYISNIKLIFRGDNHTTFSFQNPRTEPIAEALFEAPKGAKVKNQL